MPDFELSCEDFADEGYIPELYTADGEDISPPLIINSNHEDAETLALIVDDPDAPVGTFTHWLIWNIPAETGEIPKNIASNKTVAELDDACQGYNDFGELGYRGPAPPGGTHTYHFKAYLLDARLNLEGGASREKLENKMQNHIIDEAVLHGKYSR